MIWFQCGQCGKRHGRAESAAGSLVFCDCGHGNRVPWESTVAAPEGPPEVPAVILPAEPARLAAVPVGEERLPAPGARPARRERGRRRDPDFCFNHRDLPSELACDACEERFCRQCVAQVEGKTLCAPCKNYHYRALARPPRVSGLAVASIITALVAAALMLFLPLGVTAAGGSVVVLLAIALAPQLLAGLLAAAALHTTSNNPKLGGQSLAVSALVTAVVSCLVLGALTMLSAVQWV
jgi:hypothetical protein